MVERRPVRHVPIVGDVAAGTDVLAAENITESMPVPADLTGEGDLFMLRVRGDSMIDAGILDGDYVVARSQPDADRGDMVIAGIPGEEATVKTFLRKGGKVILRPANERLDRHGVRARRGHDLRTGRERPAARLTPAWPVRAGNGPARRPHWVVCTRHVDCSWWSPHPSWSAPPSWP